MNGPLISGCPSLVSRSRRSPGWRSPGTSSRRSASRRSGAGSARTPRAGSIDPGALVRLLRDGRLTLVELDEALERRSGLLAIGGTADMRALLEREAAGDERAALAVAMFVDRAAAAVAAAMTRLKLLDGLVFTGGIGENAAPIRSRICRRLRIAGVPAVPARHVSHDEVMSGRDHRPTVLRIAAREDVIIARAVERLAGEEPPTRGR